MLFMVALLWLQSLSCCIQGGKTVVDESPTNRERYSMKLQRMLFYEVRDWSVSGAEDMLRHNTCL